MTGRSREQPPAAPRQGATATARRPSAWMARLLARRSPPSRRVVLDQRRVFIAPSSTGLWFLLALSLMFLVALNYQNNMAFAVVFFLFSVFVTSILHTYGNLAGLVLEGMSGDPTYAGERAAFRVQLTRPGRRQRHRLVLGWPGQAPTVVSLTATDQTVAMLFHAAPRRGVLQPGWLLLQSSYPLGLVRAWSWLDLELSTLIYPRPVATAQSPPSWVQTGGDGQTRPEPGSEDFAGFRTYRFGDNPRHVLWRAAAKGLPLYTAEFADTRLPTAMLDWQAASGDTEQRLAQLCYWVLEADRAGRPFGLRLPGQTIEPGSGEAQRDRALKALALYEARMP